MNLSKPTALARAVRRAQPTYTAPTGRVGRDLGAHPLAPSGRPVRSPSPTYPRPRAASPAPHTAPRTAPHTAMARSPVATRLAHLRRPGAIDYPLFLAVVLLLMLGLIMVYSASQFAMPGDPNYWIKRQAIWATLGGVALVITSRIPYTAWRRLAIPGMGATLALLALTLWVGHTAYGAQRWLHLAFFSFQPSELAKLAVAFYVADWLVRKGDDVRTLRNGLLPFATLTGVVLALILLQNDMGTSLVVAALALAIFYAAGANLLQLLPTLALGGLSFWALAAGTAFRRARLDAFLHPLPPNCSDPVSYQVCQGLVSLGSGGLFGRGLGDSVQKAGYLPNPFTDSIFAVTGEELGLLGCALILALFGLLAYRGMRVSRRAPDAYGALLACGVTCWLVAQAAINIGSVVSAIPFTGVPLPFVSFGGSSLVTSLAAVGVLLNISRHARRATPTA